ncbi:MAG: 1-acyl-sn-glycerol-3-phosphate acyltransferase [Candidatus Babeliaceae bacterium]|nr:1-acyl-sn-glycerol-3-phosphate acyltransferase [Candidatus Babeliaceae bacterium]
MVKLFFRSIYRYVRVGLVMLVTIPPIFFLLLVTPDLCRCKNCFLFTLLDWWYRALLWAIATPLKVEGLKNLPRGNAIFVANHQSTLDLLMVGSLMRKHPHIWYALTYHAKKPVLGFFMRKLTIPLERERAAGAARDFLRSMRSLSSLPCHIIIFPEGTRFADGKLHTFLRGFAILTRRAERPVIPVYMPYNSLVYPPQTFWVYDHPLRMIVGEPIKLREGESDKEFTERVRQWFLDQEALIQKTEG